MGQDAGPIGETLEISVEDMLGPVAGATVTAAREGGASTATTDASGRATLEGVLAGDVLHVVSDGRVPFTLSEIPEPSEEPYFQAGVLTVLVSRPPPTDTVTVSGGFSNEMAMGEWHTVSPNGAIGFGGLGDYAVEIPRGLEARASVLEFDLMPVTPGPRAGRNARLLTGRMISLPASTSDTTLDIDLAVDALPVQTATGSFPIPPAPHAFHERGDGVVIIFDVDHPGWFLGESGIIAADAANTQFDYQANWIAPAEVTRPLTAFIIMNGRTFVRATVDGYAAGGAQAVSFPDALEVVTPELLDPWRVGDIAVLQGLAETHELRVTLSDEAEEVPLWTVVIPPGRPARLPPSPPGGVGASILTARFLACERGSADLRNFCRRAAQGPGRTVEL